MAGRGHLRLRLEAADLGGAVSQGAGEGVRGERSFYVWVVVG